MTASRWFVLTGVASAPFFILEHAHASSTLTSETAAGPATFSQELDYYGITDHAANESSWNWNLGISYSRLVQDSVVDHTTQFNGGIGTSKNWETNLSFSYASTPAEGLHEYGPSLMMGYMSTPGSEGDFIPTFGIQLTVGYLDYVEEYVTPRKSTTVRPNPASGSSSSVPKPGGGSTTTTSQGGNTSIHQESLALDGSLYPIEWLLFRVGYTRYFYSKDISDFQNALDNPDAIALGITGLSTTLAGFPAWTAHAGAQFFLSNAWDLSLDYNYSIVDLDLSISTGIRASLHHSFTSWITGLGATIAEERDASQDSGIQSEGFLQLTYDF